MKRYLLIFAVSFLAFAQSTVTRNGHAATIPSSVTVTINVDGAVSTLALPPAVLYAYASYVADMAYTNDAGTVVYPYANVADLMTKTMIAATVPMVATYPAPSLYGQVAAVASAASALNSAVMSASTISVAQ